MKLGICGTGIFARDSHLPAIKANNIQVKACTNRTRSKAEDFAKVAGQDVQVFDSLEQLAKSDVDALDILVPVDQNLGAIKIALASGKPFCFEKPIAHDLKDGREIVQLVSQSKAPVMILENWIYHNATKKLVSLVEQIGTVQLFNYQDTKPFKANKFHDTPWRQDPKHVGGYLSDAGVHDVAFLTEVLGPVKSASALTTQFQQVSGGADAVSATLHLENGGFGSYVFSTSVNAAEHELSFQIFGSNGFLGYKLVGEHGIATLRVGKGSEFTETVVEIKADEIDGLVPEFANFKEAVEKKDPSLVKATPAKGFHHFAVIVALIESSNAGGKVVDVEKL